MPTTPNMLLELPTDHDDDDVWGAMLNTALGSTGVDGHDHTTGKGVPIPSAALKIDADVAWSFGGTSRAITALKALDFAAVAASAITGYAGALFVNSDDSDNLYFRTTGGTNIKFTDGTTLNVAGFVGGIGGDYSSVGALLDYDDATDTYRFRQETAAAVRQYAKISTADIIIREYDAAGDASVPAETITIKSPDALAASYSITLPAALPASTRELWVSSAGVTTFAAAQRTMILSAIGGISTAAFGTLSGSSIIRTGASGGTYHRPIDLEDGLRIVNIRVRLKDNVAGTTCTVVLYRDVDGTQTSISAIGTSAGDGTYQTLTASAINHTVTTGGQYTVTYTFGGSAANCDLNKIEIDYDRP